MKFTNPRLMLLAPLLLLGAGHAKGACSDSTLHGSYAFTITGQILAPAPVAGPVSGVARAYFNGSGALSQVDHVVHNGILPVEPWRPAVGSYSINPNCTGWMTITPHPLSASDNSPELMLYIVVTEDGREIQTVVSGSPVSSAFTANITSTGIRVADDSYDDQ